jgi:signal transduction histidine kinase
MSKARSVQELTAALSSVAEETAHIGGLAEDLLVLARLNGGSPPSSPVEVSLSAVLRRATERHAARARALGVRLDVRAASGSASIDPARLRQALDNLLDNALRYTPRNGQIRVWAERTDGRVRITVEDTGAAFPGDFVDRAFEPFTRVTPHHADHAGAGLGLAIVRAIAEGHGGSASAENRPEGGARVVLILPTIDHHPKTPGDLG